ncbi:Ada metal-binding domain-containing protein [Pseudodesulfovibrio sediminis]|uniref:Ada metal-binding domain-containing protein n=1 Tax=Pseudodesulfovibrio sediminis TaxID=2810563 RepID=UPI001E4C7DDF|nr:Ada metal-binding domain-containing protein [Pseudodesulfovibrio sediminis]
MKKYSTSILALVLLAGAIMLAGSFPSRLACEAQAASSVYHGNRNSHIFHQPACRYFNCKNCTVVFSSREQALNAGFRPCKICKP